MVNLVFDYPPHGCIRNAFQLGERMYFHICLLKLVSQRTHLLIRESCTTAKFTPNIISWRWAIASFCNHIVHIVQMGANKQMIWIYARWIIAAVANMKAVRYFAEVEFVRDPMRSLGTFGSFAHLYKSVPMFAFARLPLPAFVWTALVNLFPKPFFDGSCFSNLVVMPRYKSNGHTFNVPQLLVRSCGDWGGKPAAAFAKFYSFIVVHIDNLLEVVGFISDRQSTVFHQRIIA